MSKLIARRIATGFARPVFATSPPGDNDRLFVVEQHTGKVRILRPATGAIDPTPYLQVTGLSTGNEQGLLGLAFSPDYAASGLFFVSLTDATGASVIRRHKVSVADKNVADPNGTTVLTIPQPFANHNGGWIAFGPKDGFLYVGIGDGGSEGDPNNTSQDLSLLLGKMLRIDVSSDDFPADPLRHYGIPADNPLAGTAGARPEIWALGLRNPWRCSFDRQTGDLYIGDVGQNKFEEVDFQPASSKGGENYGWSFREAKHPFKPLPPASPLKFTDPIFEYTHDNGEQGVIGGYVYRGPGIPDLVGTYFLVDITGIVTSFAFDGATVNGNTDRTDELFPAGGPSAFSSFGEDAEGEVYLVNLLPGEVYKIAPKG